VTQKFTVTCNSGNYNITSEMNYTTQNKQKSKNVTVPVSFAFRMPGGNESKDEPQEENSDEMQLVKQFTTPLKPTLPMQDEPNKIDTVDKLKPKKETELIKF
jgi:hypothetical protein